MGYSLAGFDVLGVDIKPQPRYPFEFIQGDAIDALAAFGGNFDAIHASPPCQAYTRLRHVNPDKEYPQLVTVVRDMLMESGRPWIIENVPDSKLDTPFVLCGSMFNLGAVCSYDGGFHQLRRHRPFELSWYFLCPLQCNHYGRPIGVYGNGGGQYKSYGDSGGFVGRDCERREAMNIQWMKRPELSQAVPPAYTEYIGGELLKHLDFLKKTDHLSLTPLSNGP